MTCDYFKELISAQIDGELSPDESRALEQHLLECAACARLSEELRLQSQSMASHPTSAIPETLADNILAATVRKPEQGRGHQSIVALFAGSYRIPRVAVWATAAVLFLLLGKIAFMPARSNDAQSLSPKKPAAPTETQRVVLTEKNAGAGAGDGLRIQRIVLSESDIISTREVLKPGQTKR
jgi:anti-sigma factor RsiW